LTNAPATVAATTQVLSTNVIRLRNGTGLGLAASFNVSIASTNDTGTASVAYGIYRSVDGTNYGTAPWFLWVIPATGTTVVTTNINWAGSALQGISAVNIGLVSNANSGTLTNKYVLYNRPNS
jgi:hypothetical protein